MSESRLQDLIDAQKSYWQADPAEKAALLERYPEGLSWPEMLRLHHLNCIELVHEDPARASFLGHDRDIEPAHTEAYTLCRELTQRLGADVSPYRPRGSVLWQDSEDADPRRSPDMLGPLANASLTHLGCIEIMRLPNEDGLIEVAFEALDVVQLLAMGEPALFRAGRLFYDDGRPEETVIVPLLYGLSWYTEESRDQDGSITRFCCPIEIGDGYASVGIGHQDWMVHDQQEGGPLLVGLASIVQMLTGLDPNDPRFPQRCAARGLDPDQVRRQVEEE